MVENKYVDAAIIKNVKARIIVDSAPNKIFRPKKGELAKLLNGVTILTGTLLLLYALDLAFYIYNMSFNENPFLGELIMGPDTPVIFILMTFFRIIIIKLLERQNQSDELLIELIETLNSQVKIIGS